MSFTPKRGSQRVGDQTSGSTPKLAGTTGKRNSPDNTGAASASKKLRTEETGDAFDQLLTGANIPAGKKKALTDGGFTSVESLRKALMAEGTGRRETENQLMESYSLSWPEAGALYDAVLEYHQSRSEKGSSQGVPAPEPLKEFDLPFLLNLKQDEYQRFDSFSPQVGDAEVLVGREDFVKSVEQEIQSLRDDKTLNSQTSKALVYTSVSGSGKTRSLLALQSLSNCTFGYLGFNSGLPLDATERKYIGSGDSAPAAAEEVLARRLVGSVAASLALETKSSILLPRYSLLYEDRKIPTVSDSFRLLVEILQSKNIDRQGHCIIAGVDEVQWLNEEQLLTGTDKVPLGRFFLRTLRQWQGGHAKKLGLLLCPVGTGISLQWDTEASTGWNVHLKIRKADETVLLSRQNFEELTGKVLDASHKTIKVVSALTWPRVRNMLWVANDVRRERQADGNGQNWFEWYRRWMFQRSVNRESEGHLLPGGKGIIHALFIFVNSLNDVAIVPDGYCAPSIIQALHLRYDPLNQNYFHAMEICGVDAANDYEIANDCYSFEKLGFPVLCCALRVGLDCLADIECGDLDMDQQLPVPNAPTIRMTLGLAMWLKKHGVSLPNTQHPLKLPRRLEKDVGSRYPFDATQSHFEVEVETSVKKALGERKAVFIATGKNTSCDYIFIFLDQDGKLIVLVVDAKHTTADGRIDAECKIQMWTSLAIVHKTLEKLRYSVASMRPLFLTNRSGYDHQKSGGEPDKNLKKSAAQCKDIIPLFQDFVDETTGQFTEACLLNKESFALNPFTDVLFATAELKAAEPKDE